MRSNSRRIEAYALAQKTVDEPKFIATLIQIILTCAETFPQ
jgi:hypothetical protein